MTKQILITFIDDSQEWIDPIEDENNDIVYTNTKLLVNNGYQNFEYDLFTIKEVFIKEIEPPKHKRKYNYDKNCLVL
jgi:hypothetical protein